MALLASAMANGSERRASARSRGLVLLSIGVGLLHHTDHVLRGDHSGWPFTSQVTPFTFSLVVYVFLLLAWVLRRRADIGAGAVALVLALTQFSHTVFELPIDQYRTWANGTNILCVISPPLGIAAVLLSLLLSVVLLTTLLSLLWDVRRSFAG
jgi:hypothetical protein